MSGRYKAVLFDLDGTILDTLEDLAVSMNIALKQLGQFSIDVSVVRSLVGNGARIFAEGALAYVTGEPLVPSEMTDRLLAEFSAVYRKNSAVNTKPYEGIVDLLDWLKNKGVYTGVLSNKPHLATLDVLKSHFPKHAFDFAAGQREGVPRKPDPAGVYEFCSALNLSTEEVLLVGDSEVDIETGRNAGLDCVGVLWGFRDKDALIKCGTKILIESPEELKKFL